MRRDEGSVRTAELPVEGCKTNLTGESFEGFKPLQSSRMHETIACGK